MDSKLCDVKDADTDSIIYPKTLYNAIIDESNNSIIEKLFNLFIRKYEFKSTKYYSAKDSDTMSLLTTDNYNFRLRYKFMSNYAYYRFEKIPYNTENTIYAFIKNNSDKYSVLDIILSDIGDWSPSANTYTVNIYLEAGESRIVALPISKINTSMDTISLLVADRTSGNDIERDLSFYAYIENNNDLSENDIFLPKDNKNDPINYVENAKNAGVRFVPANKFIIRDVPPIGGEYNTVQINELDNYYVEIVKNDKLGTKYAGAYIQVSWNDLSELDGLWFIEGDGVIGINGNMVLYRITDWGDSSYGIDYADYGDFNTNGVNLRKLVEDNIDNFPNNFLYLPPYVRYSSNGVSDSFKSKVRVKCVSTNNTVIATDVTNELKDKLIKYIIDDDKFIPKNAGYSLPDSKDMNTIVNFKEVINVSKNGNEFIFEYNTGSYDSNDSKGFWAYGIGSIDISNYIGKGYSVIIDYYNSNYSGNDSTSFTMNDIFFSTNAFSWGNALLRVNGIFGGNKKRSVINIDDYYDHIKDNNNVYMIFGGDISITNKNSNNKYDIPFEATTISLKIRIVGDNNVIASEIAGFNKDDYYNKSEIDSKLSTSGNYITFWGDSLTAGGGWPERLASLAGMQHYNGGTGGESSATIVSRQGADAMVVNNITIPADCEPIEISKYKNGGIATVSGKKVSPLLQGGQHVNPCKIGDVEGILKWTGSNYSDTNGTWTFTRSIKGDAININRPTVLRTDFDMNKNSPYLSVIFIGQNGGYSDLDDLIRQHHMMINHANAKHTIILGLSSGSKAQRLEYETRMEKEFGRYFISLRQYLSTPIYDSDGNIISCYGLDDQGLNIDESYYYNGKSTKDEIADGIVPHQILADSVHYTSGTKKVIGDYLFKKCKELNIFS